MSKYATVNSGTTNYADGKIDSDLFVSHIPTTNIANKLQIISEEISSFKSSEYDDSDYARGYLDGREVTYETAKLYGA